MTYEKSRAAVQNTVTCILAVLPHSLTAVVGFLSVTFPGWDLSLPFVMGGAVLVAMAAFQGIMRFRCAREGAVWWK